MRTHPRQFLLFFLFACALNPFPFSAESQTASEQVQYVQVRAAKLRKFPQQWAAGVADLSFGDQVSVMRSSGAWYAVQTAEHQSGYIHESALGNKKVILSDGKNTLAKIGVDDADIYLAGKGFSALEGSYAKQDKAANYEALNAIHKQEINGEALQKFIKDGKLKGVS